MRAWFKRNKKWIWAAGVGVSAGVGALGIAIPEQVKAAFKWFLAMCLIAVLALGPGCAAYNYQDYSKDQKETYVAQAEAKATVAKGLAVAAASEDARTRDMATMALLVMALTDKPLQIEAPREGFIERGLGALLSGLPYVGLSYVTLREMSNTVGTHDYRVNVDGQGNAAILNTGIGSVTANPSTSPPAIVTQPAPVVVGAGE